MNLTLCSKECPYQVEGRCVKSTQCHSASTFHDCPSCPYLGVCVPACAPQPPKGKKQRHRRQAFSCILKEEML